ncbi:phasin family protein [Sphingomonas sp. IC4-52]|uniref:phasin family protein n=1 Tax=Sphingomonas sp. IC4-52 TaxID=2887202 RepID=UPI001D10864C|nr:TIGR01841 family phasin [Sphingomonas sp. IC4-52]MCC2981425.1 TIGR01841 family phasin [Sphingomonas sp. IC4-52]
MVEAFQSMTEQTKAIFAQANERAKAQMEQSAKAFEDMNAFQKANLEAVVESSKIAAKGFEQMGQNAASYLKTSYESATGAFRLLSGVKSPAELFQLQSDFARASFDAFVAETSRSTETALKLAGEIAQPISNRVAMAVEKAKTAA